MVPGVGVGLHTILLSSSTVRLEQCWWKHFWCLAEDGHRPEWTFYPRFSSNIHTYHVGKQCFFNGVFLGNRRSLSERIVDKSLGRKKCGNVFLLNLHCAMPQNTRELSFRRPSLVWLGQTWGSLCHPGAARKIGKTRGWLAGCTFWQRTHTICWSTFLFFSEFHKMLMWYLSHQISSLRYLLIEISIEVRGKEFMFQLDAACHMRLNHTFDSLQGKHPVNLSFSVCCCFVADLTKGRCDEEVYICISSACDLVSSLFQLSHHKFIEKP